MNAMMLVNTADVPKEKIHIPRDYQSTAVARVKTDSDTDPLQLYNNAKGPWMSPVWSLPAEPKALYASKPILVNVYRDEDLFFAENETLAAYGTGDTPQDAVQDFFMHVVHFYDHYKGLDEGELIGPALKLKKLYKNLFKGQ